MRILARVATVALAGVLSVGALAAPAHAASPVRTSSSPADGARLRTAPTTVSVTFDQPVAAQSTLSVAGPSGASPCTTTTTAAAATISCTFTGVPSATVPDGSYTATYNARSTGTDPATAGGFGFVVDTVAPAAPTGLSVAPSPYLAASDTLTVTGTTESASDSVRVSLTGGAAKTVTPAADRSFSAVFTAAEVRAAADGTVTATATSTDAAGNAGTAATRTFTKDTARPTVTASTPPSGGASNLNPFVYNLTTSEAIVQSAPATTIRLFDSTGTELAATVTYPTTTSVRATPSGTVPDGSYTAQVFLTDLNGNTNDPRPELRPFTLDRSAPAAPVVTTPLATVNKANASAWPVSGTGEAGASLTVTAAAAGAAGATVTKTVTVAANGTWSTTVDLTGLADGTVSVTARQTDAAGNVSPVSSTATTSKDTVSPAVTGAAAAPTTFGGTTTTATVTGSVNDGTAVPAAENTAVQVTADDTDATTAPVVANGTSPSGTFSIPVDTASLRDGTITYRIVATDAAGNPSTAVTVTNTKDTAAPAAPTVTFNPTRINNTNKAAIAVTGSAGGTSVRIVLSDTDPTTADIVQTATVSGGSYTSTFNTTGLTDGTITATVTTTDTAGNVSAAGAGTAPKDTVAPLAPTNLVVPTYVTSGSLPVSGRAEAGATVRVTVTDSATPTAGTATATATVAADGTWSLTVDVSALAQGTLSVSAVAIDPAGNTGPAATASTTKDTVAPDQPATVTATPTTYVPSSTTFTVAGTTSTGDRAATDLQAVIVVSDGATPPATITATVPVTAASGAATAGSFSNAFTRAQVLTLADGPLTVSVTFKDAAGNTGPARTTTATKDAVVLDVVSTTPAAGAVVSAPPNASVTFNEAITPTTNPAATRSTISVTNKNGVTLAGTSTVSGRTLTFTPSSPFTEAGSPFTVTYHGVDAALTSETRDGSFTFSVDNTPPAAPVITSVTDPVTKANQTSVVISGTADASAPVRVVVAGTIAVTTTASSAGAFSVTVDVTSLADGTLTVTATQQDPAGNTSQAASATTRKDATSPTLSSAVPANGSTVTPPATVRLTFSEDLGSGTVSIPGVTGTSTVSGRTVTFTPSAPFADGTYTATASVTDAVGNPGSGSTTFTVDGTAPAAPVVATVTDPVNLANQGAVAVTGTSAEAGSRIIVTIRNTAGGASVVAMTISGSDGSWSLSLDTTPLADGTLVVSATATDTLGNLSGSSATVTTTKDTVRPTLASVVPADGSTVSSPPTIRFTFAEPLGSGTVTVNGVSGTSAVSGSTVTFTPAAPLASGSYTATASVTDQAGNAQSGQPSTTFTVDADGPAITGLAATAVTASPNRTTVTGTTDAGATVTVTVTDGTRTVTATATADDQGAFSVQVVTTTLADGTLTVRAVATDALGNTGAAAQTTTTKDATVPLVSGLAATPTTATQQSTTVTGTRSETSSVVVTATVGSQTVTGTVPSGSGAFSIALDLTGLGDGSVTVRATATDAAGNTGPRAETATTRDATRPTVTGLAATATSTQQQTTTITGTRSETSTVLVKVTDGTTTLDRTVASGSGAFSIDVDLTTLGQGPVTVTATATDAAGNVGPAAQTTAARDVTGPNITGLAATATSTGQQTTTVTGTRSEAGTVAVSVSDGTRTVTGSVPAGDDAFSLALDLTGLADGPLTVRATATDAAGNVGPTAQATAARDVTAPAVTDLAATDTTRSSNVTTVTGTRSEASTVTLSATDGTRTVTGTVPSGTGSFTATLDLTGFTPGEVTVTARPTDTAGNAGQAVTTTLTHVGPPATSTITLGVSSSRVAYQATLTLSGTVTRPGGGTAGTVRLTATSDGGTVVDLGTVPVAADGTYSRTLKPSVNATYRAVYAGDTDNTTSRSAPRRTEVVARVTASSRTGSAASTATINGTATTADGTTATLVRLNASGTVTRLATTTVSGRRFAFRVRLAKGSTRLEVRVAASLDNAAGSVRFIAKRT